jgi:hypothetical protein
MECVVSAPCEYYSSRMRAFIENECRLPRNQWIYKIIESDIEDTDERVFLDRPEWCLCLDKHSGTDVRYLVVFKDTTLKTIRDLTQHHVPLLEDIKAQVLAWLRLQNKDTFHMYFHYMPSIFQLHMHVREKTFFRRHIRIQPLHNVVQNLLQNPAHYHDALIITKFCKTLQKSESHKMIGINI